MLVLVGGIFLDYRAYLQSLSPCLFTKTLVLASLAVQPLESLSQLGFRVKKTSPCCHSARVDGVEVHLAIEGIR